MCDENYMIMVNEWNILTKITVDFYKTLSLFFFLIKKYVFADCFVWFTI